MTNSTSTTKITNKSRFQTLLTFAEVQANPDLVAFCEKQIAAIENRKKSDKPTARQLENDKFSALIAESMEVNALYSIGDIIKFVDFGTEEAMTSQRLTPMLNKMVDAGILIKEVDKRKPYFKLA